MIFLALLNFTFFRRKNITSREADEQYAIPQSEDWAFDAKQRSAASESINSSTQSQQPFNVQPGIFNPSASSAFKCVPFNTSEFNAATINPFNPIQQQQQILNPLQAQFNSIQAQINSLQTPFNPLQAQFNAFPGTFNQVEQLNRTSENESFNSVSFKTSKPFNNHSEVFNLHSDFKRTEPFKNPLMQQTNKLENQENRFETNRLELPKPPNNFAPNFQQTPVYSVPKYDDAPKITLEASTEEELITRGELPAAAFGAFRYKLYYKHRSC